MGFIRTASDPEVAARAMNRLLERNMAEMSAPTIRRFQEQKNLNHKEMRVYAGWLNWKLK